jgi:UDPglucose 6-dehydrogenase
LADAPALLEKIQFMNKPMGALQDADALIIVTEWKAYCSPNWTALKTAMKTTVIFDGRNLYKPKDIKSEGIEYHGIGRVVDAHR